VSIATSTPGQIRALVIGAGPTSVFAHLPVLAGLRDQGRLELRMVCDIERARATQARQQFGFAEESGDAASALARDDIDAVYIFGSAQLHYEYGLSALRHGKHLFVEKPIAPTYQQAMEIAQLARQRRLVAVGGLNRRFFKSLAMAQQCAGRSGWRYAEVVFHKPEFGKQPSFGARTWLSANGIHALDAMLYMMGGPPAQLTSLAATGGAAQPAIFTALMRWNDGAQGTFLCNNSAGLRREEYVFHGLGETYTIADAGLTITKNNQSTHSELPMIGDGFEAEHESFLAAIRGRLQPRHDIAAIAPSLFVAELIEAGFSGAVHLPPYAPPTATRVRARSARSILVVPSPELQPVLDRLLPDYTFVSVEDLNRSSGARRDIEAAILGRGAAPLGGDILDKLPALRVVGIMALSLARHEPQALLARNVTLLNSTEAYAESVAEFAFALAVLARRRAFVSHEVMREGGWGVERRARGMRAMFRRFALALRPAAKVVGVDAVLTRAWKAGGPLLNPVIARAPGARDLQGARVGLIGWGANARAFTRRLIDAAASVLVYSEHASADDIRAAGATPVSMGEALAADIVSLHRGLTSATRHCLGAAELAKLRSGSVLINIARGALIEPTALLARLRKGDIFACLDSYDQEPLAGADPLRQASNVFLTSHIAGGSPDMHAAAAEEVVAKVTAFLRGKGTAAISAERLRTMT
jgi:phosphoglycerate dehydrogenase-like enzyme/predicted dehydrogenase